MSPAVTFLAPDSDRRATPETRGVSSSFNLSPGEQYIPTIPRPIIQYQVKHRLLRAPGPRSHEEVYPRGRGWEHTLAPILCPVVP